MESKNNFSPWLIKAILSLLLNDEEYRDRFFPILTAENFNHADQLLYTIAKAIWLYRDTFGTFPDSEVLAEEIFVQKGRNILLFNKELSTSEEDVLFNTYDELINYEVPDKRYVEDNTVRVLSFLAVQKVLIENKDDFSAGNLDIEEFTNELLQATTFGTPLDLGINLLDDIDKRTAERNSSPNTIGLVHFPIEPIADHLEEGGLPPGSLGVVLAATNGGKSERKNTPILMYDGSIKMIQDIKVGDKLMGPDSTVRNVLSVHVGFGPMYNLIPRSGDTWGINDKHVLTLINTVYKRYDSRRSKKIRNIIDIPLNEYLKKSKTFKHKYKLFIPDQIEFSKIEELDIDPYFLGVWFGDGTKNLTRACTSITTEDVEIKNYCEKIASEHGLVLSSIKKGNASTYSLVGKSGKLNSITNKIRKLVTKDVTIPDCIKYGSIETRKQFLAGFIDTDGYLHHGFYEVIQKRKDYIEDLAFIARSLGLRVRFKSSIKTIKNINFSGEYWRLNISGETSKIPVRLERKKHKQLNSRKQGKRTGFKIEYAGEETNYGFELDGDSRYLHGDFTVTHNSAALIYLAKEAALIDNVNVLYLACELTEEVAKKRLDSCITGIPIKEIRKRATEVSRKIKDSPHFAAIQSRIRVIEIPIGATTVADIEHIIDKCEKTGFNIGCVVIDYADNLKPEKANPGSPRFEFAGIYKQLKALSINRNLVVWTASQMNDAGTEASEKEKGIITVRHINESRAKIHLADFCIAIARTQQEKAANQARVVLLKNRLGSGDGFVIKIHPDFACSRLYIKGRFEYLDETVDLSKPIQGLEVNRAGSVEDEDFIPENKPKVYRMPTLDKYKIDDD